MPVEKEEDNGGRFRRLQKRRTLETAGQAAGVIKVSIARGKLSRNFRKFNGGTRWETWKPFCDRH